MNTYTLLQTQLFHLFQLPLVLLMTEILCYNSIFQHIINYAFPFRMSLLHKNTTEMAILQSKFGFNHIISYVQMVHTHTANQWVDIFINNKELHYFILLYFL